MPRDTSQTYEAQVDGMGGRTQLLAQVVTILLAYGIQHIKILGNM